MSQIATTIEQSKRLLAAGIDPESADMCYKTLDVEDSESDDELVFDFITRPYSEYLKYAGPLCLSYRAIPAWSLSRLIDLNAETGIPINYGPMKDSADVIECAVRVLEYELEDADH